jgi:hypothetical protein
MAVRRTATRTGTPSLRYNAVVEIEANITSEEWW